MRVLSDVRPTPEQLTVIQAYQPGFVVVRGAAGSGKTTTAVLRLRFVANMWVRRQQREERDEPVRVLVLTYNRTLRGYVEELVRQQVDSSRFELTLDTFGNWAWKSLGRPDLVDQRVRDARLRGLGQGIALPPEFLADEVDYVLGRFPPGLTADYADPAVTGTYERRGRGTVPQVQRPLRTRLLEEVIQPYQQWLTGQHLSDWNDVAVRMADRHPTQTYDVVVVDEAQDFSANQVRAVVRHLSAEHSTTFVLDAVQRIYPRGFDWAEAGVSVARSERLTRNFRNTHRIAAFAYPLVAGLPLEDDGTLPEFRDVDREQGDMPAVAKGRFSQQMDWVLARLRAIPENESVALLAPNGGGWLDYTRDRLTGAGVDYVEMTRRAEWPQDDRQVALSTLHSSKGLEFDHVIVIGLGARQMPHGPDENDAQLANHRRLVAMGIGRARKTVALTYKPGEESQVVALLDPVTYETIEL